MNSPFLKLASLTTSKMFVYNYYKLNCGKKHLYLTPKLFQDTAGLA